MLAIEKIYTDGACSGNPGPGGWGVLAYLKGGGHHELGGAEASTTNNRMELQAAIAALEFLQQLNHPPGVLMYTDSEYVKKGATQWLSGWKRRGWTTAQGKPVLNQDLWVILDQLNPRRVDWRYVRGHSGDEGNERCDAIARAFANHQSPNLRLHPQILTGELDSSLAPDLSSIHTDPPPPTMTEPAAHASAHAHASEPLESVLDGAYPARVQHLRYVLETLQIADEIAAHGYFITSSELADLMQVHPSAVTSRGDEWIWRNWVVARVRREGNQILWQLRQVVAS